MAAREGATATGGDGGAAAMPIPERPKRPLSAYNLFYRFKREKILAAGRNGDDSREAILRIIMAAATGLEGHSTAAILALSPAEANELRRAEILSTLKDNISPKDTRNRSHKSQHCGLTFLEMGKAMVASWKNIDPFARGVFEGLAKEGREAHKKRVAEFDKRYPHAPKKKNKKRPKQLKNPQAGSMNASSIITKTGAAWPPSSKAAVAKRALPLPSATLQTTPTVVSTSTPFGSPESDLHLELEPLPLFPDIVATAGDYDRRNRVISDTSLSNHNALSSMMPDNPHPLSPSSTRDTTLGDFMDLISSL